MALGSSNPTSNLVKVNNSPVDVGTGNASGGTQRVVLATNQPTLSVNLSGGSGNIGNININQVYTENGASTGGESLFLSGAVRVDDISTVDTLSTSGDYIFLRTTSKGRLWTSAIIDTALPTGTNTIGKVDVNTVYTEDEVSTGSEKLFLTGAIRQDTLSITTSATGDYTNLKTNNQGRLWTSAVIDSALPAGTNNIGDVDVLTLPSIPAGTNSIGTVGLDAGTNSIGTVGLNAGTNNIGDVDVVSLPALAAGTNTIGKVDINQTYAEDSASATGDKLFVVGAVRQDSIAATTDTNGDYSTLKTNSIGRLYTSATLDAALPAGTAIIGKIGIANATDEVSIKAASTPAAAADKALVVSFAAANSATRIGDGTNLITVKPVNTVSALATDTALVVSVRDTVSVSGNLSTISTITTANLAADNTHNALAAGTTMVMTGGFASATTPTAVGGDGKPSRFWTTLSGALNIADAGGSLTVDAPVGTPVFVRLSDGTNAVTTLPVSLASVPSHAVTNAGTFAVQVDGAALTSLELIDDAISTVGSAVVAKGVQITGTDGTNSRVLATSATGRLIVTSDSTFAISSGNITPTTVTSQMNSNATTVAYASSLVIKAGVGNLFNLTGFSSKASAQWIQVHNTTAVPSANAIPAITFYVAPTSNFSLDFGVYGRYFSTGITVVCSITGPTYTAGAADCWFDAQYK